MTTTSLTPGTTQLQKISEPPTELALPKAASFLSYLVNDPDFVNSWILPFLEEAKHAEDWYVAHRLDAEDGSFSLKVFVWPPGTATKVHDHSSWGAYCCAIGSVLEERYERLDNGSRPEHARLKKAWQLSWSSEDGASTVLPGEGGIHRVGNAGERTSGLSAPLRAAVRRGGRPRLRPLPRLRLRPARRLEAGSTLVG